MAPPYVSERLRRTVSASKASWTVSASKASWSRHITERCSERKIAQRDVERVRQEPFVSGDAEEEGVRWHVGRARCGTGSTWHWIKVIESLRDGETTLITSFPLTRRTHERSRTRFRPFRHHKAHQVRSV